MSPVSQIIEPVKEEFEVFKSLLTQSFHESSDPLLSQIFSFVSDHPGKLLRPLLTILVSKWAGQVTSDTYHSAVCVEMLHSASLIHDDVVDESKLRHGMASINAQFGNKVAVLAGDYLLSCALYHSRQTKDIRIYDTVVKLGQSLSLGEILQIENQSSETFSYDAYYNIIENKTASLFAACCLTGAYSSCADDDFVLRAQMFGSTLGKAFQIVDDVFDLKGDVSLGKPIGNDMLEGKLTLPVLFALSKENPGSKAVLTALKVRQLEATREDISFLTEFTKSNGGLEYAMEKADGLRQKALSFLPFDSDPKVASALSDYCDFILQRKF